MYRLRKKVMLTTAHPVFSRSLFLQYTRSVLDPQTFVVLMASKGWCRALECPPATASQQPDTTLGNPPLQT